MGEPDNTKIMERKGIISAGNWVIDTVKFIERYPVKGNLATITGIEEGLGGCAHNVLLDLAHLKSGLPLYAAGCIGNDRYGRMVLDELAEFGIDSSKMTILPDEATSYTDVMSELGGARTFFHYRGANAKLAPAQILSCDVPARIFHLGYLLLLDELDRADSEYGVVAARVLKGLKEQGYKTSVDVVSEEGERFPQIVLPCLPYTDYLIVNEVEAGACYGVNLRDAAGTIQVEKVQDIATRLMNDGVGELVVIHFPEGGYALSRSGEKCYCGSYRVNPAEIVSTVGAGDAFCAGALFGIHEGYSLMEMLSFANACARFNLFSPTSTSGAPVLEEVKAFLQTQMA